MLTIKKATTPTRSLGIILLATFGLTLASLVLVVLVTLYFIGPVLSIGNTVIGGDWIMTLMFGTIMSIGVAFGLGFTIKKLLISQDINKAYLICIISVITLVTLPPSLYFAFPVFHYGYIGWVLLLLSISAINTIIVTILAVIFNWGKLARPFILIIFILFLIIIFTTIIFTVLALIKQKEQTTTPQDFSQCNGQTYIVLKDGSILDCFRNDTPQ